MHPLFVYGSLKEGFPNFHVNKGRRLPGTYVTTEAYPFYLADGALPCLLPQPGTGHRVRGQLFEVNEEQLAAMDALERVGEPGGYDRATITVEVADHASGPGGPGLPGALGGPVTAFVYMQHASRLPEGGRHVGPLAEYTLEHARALRW